MGEYAAGAVRWILILGAVLYLFYESLVPAVFLIPLSWIYVREWLEDTAKKKEEEFRNQFRDLDIYTDLSMRSSRFSMLP